MRKIKAKIVSCLICYCFLGLLLASCAGANFQPKILDQLKDDGILTSINNEHMSIDGVERTYRFVIINDLHVIVNNDEVRPEEAETVEGRMQGFTNANGYTSLEMFDAIMEEVDNINADAILFIGDILDFYSRANAEVLQTRLAALKTPYIFVGADHDFQPFYSNVDEAHMATVNQEIAENPVYTLEYDDLLVLGINNNTSQVTKSGLTQIQEELGKNKPTIVVTHVPLQSETDEQLGLESEKAWQDRKLLWGEDCFYVPDQNTKQFLDLVYQEISPVKVVLTGHLHFAHQGPLTNNTYQYVFAPSCAGAISVLEISNN